MPEALNNSPVILTTTNATVIYQPANSTGLEVSTVGSIIVTRVNDIVIPTITIDLANLSNTRLCRIATAIEIIDGYPAEILSRPIVVKAGQRLIATASVANYLDVLVSLAEVT